VNANQYRVLEVIQSLGKGGRTTRFVDTVNGLEAKGVYVIPLCFSEPEPWVQINNLHVIKRKEGINWLLVKKIIQYIKQYNINVIHAHCELSQFYTGIAGLMCRTCVIGTFHRSDLLRYKPSLVNTAIRLLICKYVAVSHDRLSLLTKNLNFSSDNCHVVHGGTYVGPPPSACEIQKAKERLNIPKNQMSLLSVGHLGHIKGHQDTIDAIAVIIKEAPDIHLYIAGDGNSTEKQILNKQIESLNLQNHITLLGQVNNVKEWLCACDIFVQPSIEEAFGLVFIEAGAQSKPVVATNVGGIKEIIIHQETGKLIPPNAPQEIALALQALLNSSKQRNELGYNAYIRIKKYFSMDTMINNYLNIFSQAIKNTK
jgi:glycosyltransferase involved in cell wall biosynthesis